MMGRGLPAFVSAEEEEIAVDEGVRRSNGKRKHQSLAEGSCLLPVVCCTCHAMPFKKLLGENAFHCISS